MDHEFSGLLGILVDFLAIEAGLPGWEVTTVSCVISLCSVCAVLNAVLGGFKLPRATGWRIDIAVGNPEAIKVISRFVLLN